LSERNKTGRIRVMAKEELRIQAWMEQLRRMREMQYAYHKKFFHGLYFFLALVIACLFWESPLSLALVPFLVITAGTQSCFYLHFVDFARLHARHLETQLNKALGKGTLVGSEIEDLYFYPIDAPKIGGFVPSTPLRFFSFFTFHWVLLWLGLAGFALWRLVPPMGPCGRTYLAILLLWGGIHVFYLAWFFSQRSDFQRTQERLGKTGT
jgi:hypothetical protein